MGFLLSKSMDENIRKQQEFMLHNSRLQVSEGTHTHIVSGVLQPVVPSPFLSLSPSFPVTLQRSLLQRMCALMSLLHYVDWEAESIMASEHDRLDMPQGTPSFDSIEKVRRARSSLSSLLEK
ncbi:plasminogen receptor (KT) [Morone saxatilis]|uniref:plasminogen receptor (KT) n=1 Tax=Morone saxatilis TaxID=34816 RepID=UPI0015E1E3EC|nr:plasminogen receptor (KT) [Morone saxatilis]